MSGFAMGFAFAILSAVMLGSNKLPIRISLFSVDESLAQLISVFIAIPMFGLPLLFYSVGKLPALDTVLILAGAGITNNGIGRYLIWKSISAVGANRGNVFSTTQTLYAVGIAVGFLGQPIDLYSGTGIALVFLSILSLSLGRPEGTMFTKAQLRKGLIYGIAGGFFWGVAQVLMQIGVSQYHDPLMDAFITFVFSLFAAVPLYYGGGGGRKAKRIFHVDRKALRLILLASVLGNLGIFFRYVALTGASLTVVSTVNATNPMVTLVMSQFLIRNVEIVNKRTVAAIIASVFGVALLSF